MKKRSFILTVFFVVLFGIFIDSKKNYAASIPDGYAIEREVVVPAYSSNVYVPGLTLYIEASEDYYPEVTVTSSVASSSNVAVSVGRAISKNGELL